MDCVRVCLSLESNRSQGQGLCERTAKTTQVGWGSQSINEPQPAAKIKYKATSWEFNTPQKKNYMNLNTKPPKKLAEFHKSRQLQMPA